VSNWILSLDLLKVDLNKKIPEPLKPFDDSIGDFIEAIPVYMDYEPEI